MRVLLWLAVLSGPAALLLGLGARNPAPPVVAAAAPVHEDTAARLVASEGATQWVVTWLTADADHQSLVAAWYSGQVDLPRRGARVDRPSVVAATKVAEDVWSVVVGANVQEPEATTDSGEPSDGTPITPTTPTTPTSAADSSSWPRRYYQTLVLAQPSSPAAGQAWASPAVRALTVPTPVAGPATSAGPAQLSYDTVVSPTTRLGRAVQVFLAAYLTGQGDVTPLLTPGSSLTAVTPPPAARVELTDLRLSTGADRDTADAVPADGTRVQVALTADLYSVAGAPRSSQILLTLTGRAGRWEITSLDPQPALTGAAPLPPAPDAQATTPTAPPASGSSTQGSNPAPAAAPPRH